MTVIAFSGRIASGKTTLSKAVADRLAMPWVSFGDAVRAEAARRGLASDRAALQGLGDELIRAGWDAFVETVVNQAQWDRTGSLVVDGVRHTEALVALQRRCPPHPVVVVFADADVDRRAERLASRGVTYEDAIAADSHPNEADVPAVRDRADILVDNDADLGEALTTTLAALSTLGLASSPAEGRPSAAGHDGGRN
jgi:cytidylate kinase